MGDWRGRIGAYLTPPVREALEALPPEAVKAATELRLRAGQPAMVGGQAPCRLAAPPLSAGDIRAMADAMLGHAGYARQEELRQGFVTLAGGFRAGLCGRASVKDGRLYALQDIAFITIRVARAVEGAAEGLLPWLLIGGQPVSALIVSPPGLGKTTMLRDAGRALSLRGHAVAMVDERSELAACVGGVPTLDLGPNTDVLDGCPKAEGMRLVLRAMAPRVIVTDEIGHAGDAEAVLDAARCGVAVLASAHGRDYHDLEVRPMLSALLGARVFARIAALDRIGHIGAVYGAEGESLA